MMPLTLANVGEEQIIHHVGGNDEVRRHLENLGFVAYAKISPRINANGICDIF